MSVPMYPAARLLRDHCATEHRDEQMCFAFVPLEERGEAHVDPPGVPDALRTVPPAAEQGLRSIFRQYELRL